MYPALAVAEALLAVPAPASALHPGGDALTGTTDGTQIYFVGSAGGFERPLLEEARSAGLQLAAYDEVRAGPLHGVALRQLPASLLNLLIGFFQALRLLRKVRPQALLLTGGWVNVPVALAAWLLRVPSLIYLPDIEPGLTIKALRPLARQVAVTTEESRAFIPEKQMLVTGYPLRRALIECLDQRGAAQAHFGLNPAKKTLLVFGGSRGARSINSALLDILPQLLADGVQVLHVSGTLDWERIQAQRAALGSPPDYHAHAYLHDMGLAFAAADVVVCRAGASVLGELPLFGLPSILVPYPHAWRYQKVNAEYLAQRGAALLLEDAKMSVELLPALRTLFGDAARLATMQTAARALAQPQGAQNVAAALRRLGAGR